MKAKNKGFVIFENVLLLESSGKVIVEFQVLALSRPCCSVYSLKELTIISKQFRIAWFSSGIQL